MQNDECGGRENRQTTHKFTSRGLENECYGVEVGTIHKRMQLGNIKIQKDVGE